MKSVTSTSKSSSELIENNSIKINTNNSKPIYMYEKEMKNYKRADLRSQRSPVATFSAAVLPLTSISRKRCQTHDPCFKFIPFRPPATHEILQKLFSYTLYIYSASWLESTKQLQWVFTDSAGMKLSYGLCIEPTFTARSTDFLPESVLARKARCDVTGIVTRLS